MSCFEIQVLYVLRGACLFLENRVFKYSWPVFKYQDRFGRRHSVGYRRLGRIAILPPNPQKVVRCPIPLYHPNFCRFTTTLALSPAGFQLVLKFMTFDDLERLFVTRHMLHDTIALCMRFRGQLHGNKGT